MTKSILEYFTRPIFEIMKIRTSWRTFSDMIVEKEKLEDLRDFCHQNQTGIFNNKFRYKMIEVPKKIRSERQKLGTYGFISNAPFFLAGSVENGKHDMEDFGYTFEKIILYATELGLNTCWLAGTFKRTEYAQIMNLRQNEKIPAITPIGYAANRRRLAGKIMRLSIQAKRRKPWEQIFFENNFLTPLTYDRLIEIEKNLKNTKSRQKFGLLDVFEMIRYAPSAKNAQPWNILLESKSMQGVKFHFYIKKSKSRNQISKVYSYQRLDIGIAMCHFELCMNELGFSGTWYEHNPNLSEITDQQHYVMTWNQSDV